jgi:hypothetical protein
MDPGWFKQQITEDALGVILIRDRERYRGWGWRIW